MIISESIQVHEVKKHITPETHLYDSLVNDPFAQGSKPEYLNPVFTELQKYAPSGTFLDLGSGLSNVLKKAEQYFPKMNMIGIERHLELAQAGDSDNFTIYVDSFWELQDVIDQADVIYAYEPVIPQHMDKLIGMIEKGANCKYVILNTCGDWHYKGSMLTLYSQPDLDTSVNVPQNLNIYKCK